MRNRKQLLVAVLATIYLGTQGLLAGSAFAADAPAEATAQSAHTKHAHKAHASKAAKPSRKAKYSSKRKVAVRASKAGRAALSRVQEKEPFKRQIQYAELDAALQLQSNAAVVFNENNGEVLYSKNNQIPMPIASISKLMTAMVVLDAKLPMDEPITITEADVDTLRNSTSRLQVGTTLPRGEVMLLALMSSENRAASALARTYPGGTPAFVARMNRKAASLGMKQAMFYDSSGLNSGNVATAADLVQMVRAAYDYPEIRQFSTTTEHEITAANGRRLHYQNSNALVKDEDWEIGLQKTGFINEAGKCLVMQATIANTPMVIVLLDSAGKYTRLADANRIKKWLERGQGARLMAARG